MSSLRLNTDNTKPTRTCSICGRRIPLSQASDKCKECLKASLFPAVKDYIRANDCNELMVAEHFNLDTALVHEWVEEGRLQYKNHVDTK